MDVSSLYDSYKNAKNTDVVVRCMNGLEDIICIDDFRKYGIVYEAKDAKNTFKQLDKKEKLKEKLRAKLNKK